MNPQHEALAIVLCMLSVAVTFTVSALRDVWREINDGSGDDKFGPERSDFGRFQGWTDPFSDEIN